MIFKEFENYQSLFLDFEYPPLNKQCHLNETISDMPILNENLINIQEAEDINNYYIYCLEKQTTKWKYLNKNNIFPPAQQSIKEDKSIYKCVSFEEIKENLITIKNSSEIGEKLTKNKNIEDAEKQLCKIKRKRDNINKNNKNKDDNNEFCVLIEEENNVGEKKKRGRKITTIKQSRIDHNKYSQDNIIKKIKSKLLSYALKFLNNLISKSIYSKKKYRLYKLEYKYIKNLKKKEDLKILNMKLKDLYSLEVSPKYKNISKYHNKNIIKQIIKNKELKNYQAILFALNLTFKEWVQLFTYKKSIDDIIQYNKESENIIEEIEINMIHVESLLKKIMEDNDEHFLSIFTFFLYNYEEWFLNKQERKRNYKNIIK